MRSWLLKKYKGNDNKPLDLVNTAAGLDFPFSLYFPNEKPAANVNWAWYKQTADPDGLGVTYEFSDGHISVRKVFRFQKNSYLSMVSTEVTLDGKPLPHMIQWRGGFGDLTVANPSGSQRTLYFDVPQNKLVEQPPKAAAKGPGRHRRQLQLRRDRRHLLRRASSCPKAAARCRCVTFADTVKTRPRSEARCR